MVIKLRFLTIVLATLLLSACGFIGNDGYLFGAPKFGFGSEDFSDEKFGPKPNISSKSAPASGMIVVEKGDTLYSISRTYNVPIRDVVEENSLTPPYILKIGQEVRVPKNKYHTVAKGDTLYNISKRYDVDVTSLSRVNKLSAPYTISIGDELVLPGSISSTPTVAKVQTPQKSVASRKVAASAQKKTVTNKRTQTRTPKRVAQAPARKTSAKYTWPVKGPVIATFGSMGKGKKNDGINIKASQGTKVVAADKGSVVYAGNELKGFGNLVLIKHPDGSITAYAHNYKIHVRKGQSVYKGQQISSVGMTGGVTVPQLHFEVHINKKPVNPTLYLP